MKKEIRIQVYNKYNGRCAYCGEKIEYKDMQVDHIKPVHRPTIYHEEYKNDPGYIAEVKRLKSELKAKENLNDLHPSCAKCNNYKHSLTIEQFRNELSLQVYRLKKDAQFQRALRFNQIEIKEKPIVFYFEK